VFISPVSVELVLALAYMGAAGTTGEEIASALHLPPDRDDVMTGFSALLGSLKVKEDKYWATCRTRSSVSTGVDKYRVPGCHGA
jgi:serpin B